MHIFQNLITTLLALVLGTTLSMEAIALTQEAGPPTLLSVDVIGSNVVLSWTQENAIPDRGYDIHINGLDTNGKYRTHDTSVTIGDLDLSQSHCFNIEPYYHKLKELHLSNQLCSSVVTANQAPSISGTPASSVTEGESYLFSPNASDPDGDSLSFSIVNKPAWASFNTATGALSGTPPAGSAGIYSGIAISVSDGELSASLAAFDIEVVQAEPINQAPSISGTPANSVTEGESYLFSPSASDPDGDSLSFSIANKPAWASFNTATGTLSGTPPAGSAGIYSGIAISVSDSELSASLAAFDIEVVQANQAPEISGTPAATVTVDVSYSFTPSASDADGDSLSFSVNNLPAWASFDVMTGTLYGVPQAVDVGTYDNILISVSDGTDSSELTAFSIMVEEAPLGSTILSWVAPSTREDGSVLSLSEIGGYRIYMGESVDSLEFVLDVNDGSAIEYTMSDIPQGEHYFAVSVYDIEGNESILSNIVLKSCL